MPTMTEVRVRVLVLSTVLIAGLASAAPTYNATDQQKLDRELAGLIPGRAQDCIDLQDAKIADVQGAGPTLLYKLGRGLVYRNDTAGGCEKASRGDIVVTDSISGKLCRGDIARTVRQLSPATTGSCTLGAFVPYRRS